LQTPVIQSATAQWLAFLTPLMVALLTITQLVIAKLAAQKVQKVADVAVDVANRADHKSETILVLAEKTHTLVNSQYGIALALILEKAQRIAALSQDPSDIEEVQKAKAKLAEHEAKQHVVDSREERQ